VSEEQNAWLLPPSAYVSQPPNPEFQVAVLVQLPEDADEGATDGGATGAVVVGGGAGAVVQTEQEPQPAHAVRADCPDELSVSEEQNPWLLPPSAYVSQPPNPEFQVAVLVHAVPPPHAAGALVTSSSP
jgi:hypothetical protein